MKSHQKMQVTFFQLDLIDLQASDSLRDICKENSLLGFDSAPPDTFCQP